MKAKLRMGRLWQKAWPCQTLSRLFERGGRRDAVTARTLGFVQGGVGAELSDTSIHVMEHIGQGRYSATIRTDRPGTFGYAVRVVPRHQLLAHPAQTGLITYLEA